MNGVKEPKFSSREEARDFWVKNDVFEVLGEEDWEFAQRGEVSVQSIYVGEIGPHVATLRLPKEILKKFGLRTGEKVKISAEKKKLVIESVSK